MAKNAEFKIVINGIQESINAVDALNKELDALEKRINTLANKNVSVSASGGGNAKALDEEAKLLKQIEQLHQKVRDTEKEEYQELLNAKQELKEYQTIAKSIAAQENLKSGINNTNTMMGAKAQLRDLKAAMQTVDMNGDQFKKWAAEANELTQKLKEAEASYGTFSRNVGNYANGAYEGMKKFNLEIGGVTKEFESAKQAVKELKAEMQTLQYKQDKGIITEEETERFKSLVPVVRQLESAIQDAGKPMDALLDTMQSITAIASVGQGLSALFGLDDSEIEKSIQKLVALQNVLQGLQTIEKQIQTQEGIGSWLSKGNAAIDKFAAGLLKAEKNAKLLASGLKMLGAGAIIAGITALVVLFNKFQKSQEEARKAFERNLDVIKTGAEAYKRAEIELNGYIKKLDEFKGSKKAEKQLIEEVSKKYDIHNKNIKDVKDMKALLIKMAPTYLETIKEEAKMTALAAESAKLYADNIALIAKRDKLQTDYNNLNWNERLSGYGAALKKQLNDINTEIDANAKSMDVFNNELDKSAKIVAKNKTALSEMGIGGGKETTKKIKDNAKKTEDAVRQAENNINELRLKLMRDGFYKELMQLDDNNRKEIDKIKKNGQKVEEQLLLQQQNYEKQQQELRDKYTKSLQDSNAKLAIDTQIESIQRLKDEWEQLYLTVNRPTSTKDAPLFGLELESVGQVLKNYNKYKELYKIRNDALSQNNWEAYFEALKKQYLPNAAKEVQEEFFRLLGETRPDSFDKWLEGDALITKKPNKEAYNYLKNQFEEKTKELRYFILKYSGSIDFGEKAITQTLQNSYLERIALLNERYKNMLDVTNNYINQKKELELEAINNEEKLQKESIDKELDAAREGYEKLLAQSKKYSAYTPESVSEYLRVTDKVKLKNGGERDLTEEEKNLKTLITLIDEKEKERTQIVQKYTNQRKKIEQEANNEQQANNAKYYDRELESIEAYMQKANDILSKQPETNELGFIDIKKTKTQYKEVLDLYKEMTNEINSTLYKALTALGSGEINGQDFERIVNNLEYYKKKIKEENNEILKTQKGLGLDLYKQIDQYLQMVGQAATQIIQSIGQINDAAFEKEMEALDKRSEYYEDLLEKQKEITQKYADDVNDIEDELSSSRGDRRQYLIDMLNQQMAAQRESLAQEKQIEKEQERIDKKREKLEYDNEMRKWNQSKLTAAINAALAISAAAVNTWPMPAIPMMALATAVGAAQMAAVLANKPKKYAEGGLLEGRSHAQGGIPVGNSGIEVEGNEFVTNKRTTSQNLALLQFINSKKRKIDLSDMIEFYSSKANKNISNTKTYFADGGQIPVLRNDIDLSDRLITTMEKYSEKPTVVQVVDIINKAESLRQVQTLAGLS